MMITKTLWVHVNKQKEVWSNISGTSQHETDKEKVHICMELRRIAKTKKLSQNQKETFINSLINDYINLLSEDEKSEELKKQEVQVKANEICQKLINFFSEFDFEPNFRFVNTLSKKASNDLAKEYVMNYFYLTDNQFADSIAEKVKSREFEDLVQELKSFNTSTSINKRFSIFYGSQGTGKTTEALKLSNNVVMVCHSAMLPSDLLEDFKFENGQPSFKKSALWLAMENGTAITLDEINLLPFESLRFLQSILDNKTQITYKGQTINIKDGFNIIGTMNLKVNGAIFNLPEPLVDRAFELKQYKLTASQLSSALL